MAEVFTISGPAFRGGFGAAACPTGWQITPNGNCGAPVSGCPSSMKYGTSACRSQTAVTLQNALRGLGLAVGDPVLKALAVDGFIGPNTTAAVNRAFTMHIGPGQADAVYRTGVLTAGEVAGMAPVLTHLVATEVARRGAVIPDQPTLRPPSSTSVPTSETPVLEAGTLPNAAWFLAGAMALLSATGAYLEFREPRYARRGNVIPFRRYA